MVADYSDLLLPGEWEHQFVSANGARFHVAVAGPQSAQAPRIVLLHSVPQLWWTWRHQITALADAGYRVAAMDLRGHGASDKPPQGYDMPNLTRDVAGVIRALGAGQAIVIGHGLGGTVAWSMPTLMPAVTTAVVAVSAPHPARVHASMYGALTAPARRRLNALLVPGLVEHRFRHSDLVATLLSEGAVQPWEPEDLEVYRTAMRLPAVAHSSLETYRWFLRNATGATHRRYLTAVRAPIAVPALQLHGAEDPYLHRRWVGMDSGALATRLQFEQIAGSGHFPQEERSDAVTEILLTWLAEHVPAAGASASQS